jgi:hypothetical protein
LEDIYFYSNSSNLIFKFCSRFIWADHTKHIAGEYVILGAVCIFALTWILKAKPHNRSKGYSIVIFNIFGKKSRIEGIRTEFKTLDVAWSFMKQYKKSYRLYNFALISDFSESDKPTIVKYV